jgi:hypothetical protein
MLLRRAVKSPPEQRNQLVDLRAIEFVVVMAGVSVTVTPSGPNVDACINACPREHRGGNYRSNRPWHVSREGCRR